MNWQHLRAIVWLRWRLRLNQLRRAGSVNSVLLAILGVGALVFAAGLFVVLFLVGLFTFSQVSSTMLLYLWDGLVIGFLICWAAGLLTDLQRSEALSLEKFLHLPVSLAGVFALNYVSSMFSLTLMVFLPAMLGLSLGLIFAKGPLVLLLLPLLAAFLLMVTAVTYQFQGWLASLMVNKRRRRTVIVVATMMFVLIFQLPNLLRVFGPWKENQNNQLVVRPDQAVKARPRATPVPSNDTQRQQEQEEIQQKNEERLHELQARAEEAIRRNSEQVQRTVRLINLVAPLGWLPLGVAALAEGNVLPALLGTLGLALIGAASLWRSYWTTVRLYTGQFSWGRKQPVLVAERTALPAASRPAARDVSKSAGLLEQRLPLVSEHASAIALASFRSLTRAPEAKMMLLTPIILVIVFGGMFLRQAVNPPDAVRPLMAFGAMGIILLSMVQLIGNQFGFDRNGFRVFVLCGARRGDILMGKNLASAPLALGLSAVLVILLQAIYPMRLDYFLAVLPQMLSMYLLFCMLANCLSILAPMLVAAGAFKATNFKLIPILLHLAFVFLFPLALAPTLLPLAVQIVLEWLGWAKGVPIGLVLSIVVCVAVVFLYRVVVTWQGDLLQAREQRILEIVTTKAE